MKNIETQIKYIISKKLDLKIDKISNNSLFIEDLGADSLDIVEFIMTLEEDFNIEISDDEVEKIKTVQNSIDFIEQKIHDKNN